MKKLSFLFFTLSFALWLQSCSKGNLPYPPGQKPTTSKYVLDSMIGDESEGSTYFSYRSDGLQDKIVKTFLFTIDTVSFEYNGKQISRLTSSRLHKTSEYFYNPLGKISSIKLQRVEGIDDHYRFDFTYDISGKVKLLEYFTENKSAKTLIYTCSYQYNTDGLLSKVLCETPGGGSIITFTIDAYTEECDFNPWAFIETIDLTDGFEIYNLPLMQGMKRLPAKITKTLDVTSYTHEVKASIQNRNIIRTETSYEFPDNPKNNYSFGANFFYHK